MFKIELSKAAAKDIEKIYKADRILYRRFINAFESITKDPSRGKLLHGKLKGLSSYRMGSYRIIYPEKCGKEPFFTVSSSEHPQRLFAN